MNLILLLCSLFLLSESNILISEVNKFHLNSMDDNINSISIPNLKEDNSDTTIYNYFFKNFIKGTKSSYKIIPNNFQEYYIILVCSKDNTMTVSSSEHNIVTRLFLIENYLINYNIVLENDKEDYFFEVSFIPKLVDIDFFNHKFEKEYHKIYSPQNYIYILVNYLNFQENSLLYYDPYISYPEVKYIPLKENTKFDDVFFSEVESYDFFSNSYVPKDQYFIIKIHTNASYDFYIGLDDDYYSGKSEFFIFPLFYNQYLLQENQQLLFKKINNQRGILVKILAQSNPNVQIYVEEYYSKFYLNETVRERTICCSNVFVKVLNGYALIGALESSDTFGDLKITYIYYSSGGLVPYNAMNVFETYENSDYKDYNILGFKVNINHFSSIKCNAYSLGGFKFRGYYTGYRGISYFLNFQGSESVNYYYPSDLINENSLGEGQYGIPLYCPCCTKWGIDYSYSFDYIYYNVDKFKTINENNPTVLYNNSNFEDFDNVTYKISPPKNKNQYLKIQISNCDDNFYNFHLLRQFNVSYYTLFLASLENDIILPMNKNDLLNLNNLYVYLEKYNQVSFEYEYIELDFNYKIKYSNLIKDVNFTMNNGKAQIEFYPILFDEEMEYKLYILEKEKINIRKCNIYKNNLKNIDIGNYLIYQKDENYTIKKNIQIELKNSEQYSLALMAYQKDNYKYKYLYNTIFYTNSNSENNSNNFFENNKALIIIVIVSLILIAIAIIIIVIIIKKKKSDKDLEKDVEEFKGDRDSLLLKQNN